MIIVNPTTRQFNIPGTDQVFGVTDDASSEIRHFQCPRYVGNNVDVAGSFVRINYRNGNGEIDSYLVQEITVDGSNVLFDWVLSQNATMYKGNLNFVMCVVGPDTKVKWHTTLGRGQVLEGLEPDSAMIEQETADVVAQLISLVEAQTAVVEKTGADQVAVVKAAAKTAQDSAVAEIEAKRVNSLASIPADYTALSATVDAIARTVAPGIVCSAEGEVITLNDASDNYLRGLRIFGKSTQDGIPTPENPVEIVSIENPTINVGEQTISIPRTLYGIPVDTGGNYTDASGQQWICDEVDFERGVRVKRVVKATDFTIIKTLDICYGYCAGVSADTLGEFENPFALCTHTNNYRYNTDDYTHYYVDKGVAWVYLPKDVDIVGMEVLVLLKTPIETLLSETELATYRALHANKPNTTILNDSGAYMSVDYTADTKLYIDNKLAALVGNT